MELLKFINQHDNWKELLQGAPYFLEVKEDEGYVLLKYNQIKSDFSQPIVQQARGIIVKYSYDCGLWKIVCRGFDKFFNYGEPYAADIDWSSARVQEKIDGSIMKVWYDDGAWRLSTNGSINAYQTELNVNEVLKINCPYSTFGDLFDHAVNRGDIPFSAMNPNYTYMFELVSPYNKIVISYPQTMLTHIGTRNSITGEELNVDIGIVKPKEYPINSLQSCIAAANELPSDAEGYVVVDGNYNRIKVKNPIYLRLHRMISNNQITTKDIVHIICENEQEEFLTYFPEYKGAFEKVEFALQSIKNRLLQNKIQLFQSVPYINRKDFALEVMKLDKENSDFYFKSYDKKDYSFQDWINAMQKDRLVEKIKKETKE